jgi:competence protein ComGF
MANLAAETKDMGFQLEQVQGFTPTPMTVATVIYYSGYHPYTLKKVYVSKTKKDRDEQHKFFFWYKKENFNWIKNTLQKVQRNDLVERLLSTGDSYRKGKSQQKNNSDNNRNSKKQKNRKGYVSVLNKPKRHRKKKR